MNESDSMITARSKGYIVDLQRILEELDPKDKHIGTDLEGLDAFDRQLRRFEIYNTMETKGDLTYARIRIYN